MIANDWFGEWMASSPVIGIFRGQSERQTLERCRNAWAAGVELVEIPISGEGAMDVLAAVAAESLRHGRFVGAGTVTTPAELDQVVKLGARFAVSPGSSHELLSHATARGIPLLPGVASASEVMLCRQYGYRWQKLFPAASLGSQMITSLAGPFPDVYFVATGGVTKANASEFLAAGASAIGASAGFDSVESARELLRAARMHHNF